MFNDSRIARIGIAILFASTLILGAVGGIGAVSAEECDPSEPEGLNNCDEDDFTLDSLLYEAVWENVYLVVHTTLQYAGFVAVFAGVTLWWGTTESSDRAQIGMWLTFSGLAMVALFFGGSTLVELVRYVAEGG